jgi:RimJ/RimL family protein N-acetyltransferase
LTERFLAVVVTSRSDGPAAAAARAPARELDKAAGIRERDRHPRDHRSAKQHGPLVVGVVGLVRHPRTPSAILADLMSTREIVTLRDVTEADLPIFFEFERDPVANEMAAFPARDREAFMQHWTANILGNDTRRKRTILLDDVVVGNILSWEQSGDTLVGYWIGREYWGRGVATRALTLFLTEVDTRPLHAHVVDHNVDSIRVLEKCGFRIVGEETVDEPGVRIVEVILRLEADPVARRAGFEPAT